MEKAVSGESNEMHLDYTTDVMSIMTDIRKSWGFLYPEEQNGRIHKYIFIVLGRIGIDKINILFIDS